MSDQITYGRGTWSREILETALRVHAEDIPGQSLAHYGRNWRPDETCKCLSCMTYRRLAPRVGFKPLVFEKHDPRNKDRKRQGLPPLPKISQPVSAQWLGQPCQQADCAHHTRRLILKHSDLFEGDSPEPQPEQVPEPQPEPEQVPEPRSGDREWLEGLPSHERHERTDDVILRAKGGFHVYMKGGAGTGKSYIARDVADTLAGGNLHEINLANAMPSAIDGSVTPDPERPILDTAPIRWARKGGFLFMDEIDRSHPTTLVPLNGVLAMNPGEQWATKYFGSIPLPEDARVICAGNTWGTSTDKKYRSANALDFATIDRVRMGRMEINRDAKLENHLVKKVLADADDAGIKRAREYYVKLTKLRKFMEDRDHDSLESMRTMVDGVKGAKVGIPVSDLIHAIVAPWSDDSRRQALAAL